MFDQIIKIKVKHCLWTQHQKNVLSSRKLSVFQFHNHQTWWYSNRSKYFIFNVELSDLQYWRRKSVVTTSAPLLLKYESGVRLWCSGNCVFTTACYTHGSEEDEISTTRSFISQASGCASFIQCLPADQFFFMIGLAENHISEGLSVIFFCFQCAITV